MFYRFRGLAISISYTDTRPSRLRAFGNSRKVLYTINFRLSNKIERQIRRITGTTEKEKILNVLINFSIRWLIFCPFEESDYLFFVKKKSLSPDNVYHKTLNLGITLRIRLNLAVYETNQKIDTVGFSSHIILAALWKVQRFYSPHGRVLNFVYERRIILYNELP